MKKRPAHKPVTPEPTAARARVKLENGIYLRPVRKHCSNRTGRALPRVSIQVFQPQSDDEAGEPGSRNDHVRQISGRDIDLQKDQIAELQGGEIQSGQKGVCREFNHRRNTFLQNVPIPF